MKTYKEQYGKRMRFVIAQLSGILLLPLVATAAPTLTTYNWMTNSSGRAVSGSFGDGLNWIGGEVPGELSLARFFYRGPTSGNGGYTVTLPTMETKATLRIHARDDIPITFDGSGNVFQAVSTESDNYGAHFISIYGGQSAPDTGFEQAYFENASFRGGYKLTDAIFTVKPGWMPNGCLEYVVFQQGTFNFYDPEGVPLDSTFVIAGRSGNTEAKYIFNPDSILRIKGLKFLQTGSTRRQTVWFNGNTHHVFGDLWFNQDNDVGRIATVHVDKGAILYAGRFRMSNNKPSSESGYNGAHQLFVENGGTLICSNGVDIAAYGTQLLAITNGANVTFGTEATVPLNQIMGANHSDGVCYSTNTLFVKDSTLTMVGTNQFSSMNLVLDNATANFGNSFSFGKNAKGHTYLFATNSTMNFGDINPAFGCNSSHRAFVELYNTKINASGKVYLGAASSGAVTYENNAMCDTTIDGPESDIALNSARGGSRLTLGSQGSSIFRIKDGAVSTYQMLMAADPSCVTSVLHQTGGAITVTGGKFSSNEDSWYGFNVNDSLSSSCMAYCRVILDGGEIRAHRFWVRNPRQAGSARWSRLDANGGTIVGLAADTANNNITVKGFDEANLGEMGLTIRSDYETRTAQDFRDMEGHEGRGLLRLEGEGTKKLYGTNSTESVLMCAGGKTLFVPNTDTGANASHYSNVIVTNGATLSISGDQTVAAFRSLTLERGAHLEMEKSDRITVDGLLAVGENLALDIADGAAVGSYPLIVCAGEASAESCLNWRRAVVAISGRTDLGVTPIATYDSTTDKTTFSLEITEGGPLAGNVTWDGSWNATGADRVTFAGGGTASVAVDSNVTVGALAFDSSIDYMLSGVGTLEFSDRGGYARVDVARGEQTISASVIAPQDLTLASASGAKLTVDGEIVVGGVIKEGRGTVALENPANDLSGGVTVKEGLLSVPTPEALGKGPISLEGGTLEVTDEGGTVLAPYVSLATAFAATAAVVKVETDVTMPAPSATQGAFIKRGVGRLTLSSDKDVSVCGTASGTFGARNDQYVSSTTAFDGEGGYSVNGVNAFGGFNIAEGELVLKGTADDVTFTAPAYACIGINTSDGTASPGLVIDHANFICPVSSSRFLLGSIGASSFPTAPHLIVTNKSMLVGAFTCGRGSGSSTSAMSARVLVDDSVQYSTYMFYPMRSGKRAEYVYRNGSALYVAYGGGKDTQETSEYGVRFNDGPATMTFSNSVLARKRYNLSDVIYPVSIFGESSKNKHEVYMRDGSTLYSNWVSNYYASAESLLTIGFDNSEWKPICSGETGDFTFDFPPYETVRFKMEGRGVILSPAAEKTFTLVSPFVGEGGMRKRGAGTLAFACKDGMKSWDFGGTLSLEEGTVTLAAGAVREGARADIADGTTLDLNGTTIEGAVISGEGVVANGTLDSSRLMAEVSDVGVATRCVTLSGVSFSGRTIIDFGRTEENPLPDRPLTMTLFAYTGTAPDVGGWKVNCTGREGVSGSFKASAGVVTCTIIKGGLTLFVR